MEKIQAELKEETSKRDHARNARVLKRKEAVVKKVQDEKKDKMQRQPNVKEETLKNMKIRFHRTSDELHQF